MGAFRGCRGGRGLGEGSGMRGGGEGGCGGREGTGEGACSDSLSKFVPFVLKSACLNR